MELRGQVNTVNTNISQSGQFTIKQSAKAFKILSDNLYSDKISAVIRELSCNAYDAHVSAGKASTPFKVHMPNRNEPFFSVTDEGTGMSKDFAMNLYTSYFDSDKTDRNDLVGALGLGSKSPFAYVESFTVTSRFEGIQYAYTCFISETGCPSITLMSETPTTEPNGVEVKLPVNQMNFSEFQQKAISIFKYFKVQPIIENLPELPKFTVLSEGNGWRLIAQNNYDNRPVAIQGNVAYPIDKNRLGRESNKANFVSSNMFLVDFAIGDLDVAASREALSYDKATIDNIKQKLEQVYDEFVAITAKKIADLPNKWEATCAMRNLTQKLNEKDMLKVEYKGQVINQYYFKIDTVNLSGTQVAKYDKSSKRGDFICRTILTMNPAFSIETASNARFFINDELRTGVSKIRQQINLNTKLIAYVLDREDAKFFEAMGNPKWEWASKLPEVEKKASTRTGGTNVAVKPFIPIVDGSYSRSKGQAFEELDLAATKYYIVMKRDDVIFSDGTKQDFYKFSQKIRQALVIGALSKNVLIYGVPTWALQNKKFKSHKKFVNLLTVLDGEILKVVKQNIDIIKDRGQAMANVAVVNDQSSLLDNILKSTAIANRIKNGSSMFFTLRDQYTEVKKLSLSTDEKVRTLHELAESLNLVKQDSFKPTLQKLDEVYPMFQIMDTWGSRREPDIIANYINAMDQVNR